MTEKHVASIPIGRLSMISIKECKIFAAEYKTLGCEPDISARRSTVLLSISRSWIALAHQLENLTMIDEEKLGRPS